MEKTVMEIAALINGSIIQNPANPVNFENMLINGVTNIEDAGPSEITFAVEAHLDKAAKSNAGVVIVPKSVVEFPKLAIKAANPRLAFTTLLKLYTPQPSVKKGIHPSAVIGENVTIGDNVSIMAFAVIEDNVSVGDNTIIYPHSYIGANSEIGNDTLVYSNVSVRENCKIGSRVIINSGAVIGSEGFGFITDGGIHHKVPQVGKVIIEDDVELGANTCIDRATTGSTIVKKGTKIDNLVHIAHNVTVGEYCFLVAQTGISGSVKIGNRVTFAGQSGSSGHLTIGDNCIFAARAGVTNNVPADSFYSGFPARPHQEWLRAQASLSRLPEFMKKMRKLSKD